MSIKLTFLLIINLSLLIERRVLILILDERLLLALCRITMDYLGHINADIRK